MNTFAQLRADFRAGRIDKAGFIAAMQKHHALLADYAGALGEGNIGEIRVVAGEVTATFKQPPVTMVCPPLDARIAPIEAFNFGDYEAEEIRIVRDIIGRLGGAAVRFLDIGANAGYYSLALAHFFPGLRGHAFEPIPVTYGLLRRNFELNRVTGITPHNLGLSDRAGELKFYTYPSQSGSSSMTRNIDGAETIEVRCPVLRLDDFATHHGAGADFIKCDVEGAELFVLRGAAELLRRDQPAIFTEMLRKWCAKYDYHPNDIIAYLATLGYGCHVVRAGRLQACPTVTTETTDTNFVFLHREKHAGILGALAV